MSTPLSSNLSWEMANNLWAQAINPVLSNQLLQGKMISGVTLAANTPLILNHGLGRTLLGWFTVDNTASCSVWRTQPLNSKTITIEASAATTLSLWVF